MDIWSLLWPLWLLLPLPSCHSLTPSSCCCCCSSSSSPHAVLKISFLLLTQRLNGSFSCCCSCCCCCCCALLLLLVNILRHCVSFSGVFFSNFHLFYSSTLSAKHSFVSLSYTLSLLHTLTLFSSPSIAALLFCFGFRCCPWNLFAYYHSLCFVLIQRLLCNLRD